MSARTFTLAMAALAVALVPLAASAMPVVKLYALEPAGFDNQLRVTGFTIGKVIHTADGGQVFGFDVDWNGTDGLLASARTISPQGQVAASVETFDQSTAKITKTIVKTRTMDDFVAYGIFMGDVGLVQHDHVVNNVDQRSWHLLNPVTGFAFTGKWTPPNAS